MTVCPYCATGCGMRLSLRDGRISEVSPDPAHPVSEGKLCLKGLYGFRHVADPGRLTMPLMKRAEGFSTVSWATALDTIAAKLTGIKGADAFALTISGHLTNEDNYLARQFARLVMGTNAIHHGAPLPSGLKAAFGSAATTNAIPELGDFSDVIFIIGSNTAECHPLIAKHVLDAKARGAKLIVADPRRTDMANKADLWLRVPPGSDIALLDAMQHQIIKDGLHNLSFIRDHVTGFEGVAASVEAWSPEKASGITGIPTGDIIAAAKCFGRARAAAIVCASGVAQDQTLACLANLAAITGQIGRPGAGIFALRGSANSQGASDPPIVTVDLPEAILAGKIHSLFIAGGNPVISHQDTKRFQQALGRLDFLVVADLFLTETARHADIVLPAAGWAEKDGTVTNTERRVQRVRATVAPPGEARADWLIFQSLAQTMGCKAMAYARPEAIWDDMRHAAPTAYGGISYARLDTAHGLCWPCPAEDHPGTPILHLGGNFLTPSGKAVLTPVPSVDDATVRDEAYPFTLITGHRVYHFGTGTMTRRAKLLAQIGPEALIELNPDDAVALAVRDGEFIKVTTAHGEVVAKAWVTERVPRKNLFATFHFWEANINEAAGASRTTPARVAKSSIGESRTALARKRAEYRPGLERIATVRMQAAE
jgi:formate dehydrogenase major subunit